ncbi:MAG: T9SS type A sorting domain-containing protein [Bacteroidota bacterium]
MKKNLLLILILFLSGISKAQVLGNLVSIVPASAPQGQTLTTTITEQPGTFMVSSPPCDNYGIFLLQGIDTIFCNSYNWQWMDVFDAEFSIPAAAPLGFYDVYVASTHYDWWTGTCQTLGYWQLPAGFEVTLTNGLNMMNTELKSPVVSPNPFNEKATINFSNREGKKYQLIVIDAFGREVTRSIIDRDHIPLNMKDFDSGIYFYKLDGLENKNSFTGKFVVSE